MDLAKRRSVLFSALFAASIATACAAIYPELTTPIRVPASTQQLDPPPPGLYWIAIREGTAPEKTRDGRPWHELGGKLPDPYVVLFVNGKELLRTNPESSTLHPTWADSPRGNFRFGRTDKLRVEMWQSGLVKQPICVKNVPGDADDWAATRQIRVSCDGGAEVVIAWEPAHARYGYGFNYELRTSDPFITRVFEESPASRAGVRSGDQLTSIGGRSTHGMKAAELQEFFNMTRTEGVSFEVKHASGEVAPIQIKEGSIYPLFSEVGSLP